MTQEEKQLLLVDLCARLPYKVQCEGFYEEDASYKSPFGSLEKVIDQMENIEHVGFDDGEIYVVIGGFQCELCDVKPYLRPMSSMTEEEKNELYTAIDWYGEIGETGNVYTKGQEKVYRETFYEYTDWLNAHHFDYRGLIPMGLAIAVTEENNPYKE